MATTWTPELDQQLRDLHTQGLSQAECARRMGISNRRVSEHSKVIGLSWDRSKTMAAVIAQQADNKAARATLEARLLVVANDALDQMGQPFLAFSFGGKDNVYAEHLMESAPTVDRKNLMHVAAGAIDRSLKIAVHDGAGGDNVAAVDKWLTFMTGEAGP